MKKQAKKQEVKKVSVLKCEFHLNNGKHIVWTKEAVGWSVIVYQHDYKFISFKTVSHEPTIVNAKYYADKY